jgi:hypothetical protein
MVQLLRPVVLAGAVCASCLVATACALEDSALNRSVDAGWHALSTLLALGLIGIAVLVARAGVVLVELAASGVAGGLAANSLVARSVGGVADFVHAGGWIYSPGDLAMLGGTALLAVATAVVTARAL